MRLRRQARVSSHKKQERLQLKKGAPTISDLKEGVPVLRSTDDGVVEYVKYNGILYRKTLDMDSLSDVTISDYVITWTANEKTAGNASTIDDGNTVGDDNEAGQAIADLTAKVNDILKVLRLKHIIK